MKSPILFRKVVVGGEFIKHGSAFNSNLLDGEVIDVSDIPFKFEAGLKKVSKPAAHNDRIFQSPNVGGAGPIKAAVGVTFKFLCKRRRRRESDSQSAHHK